jgi:hypothetical protein
MGRFLDLDHPFFRPLWIRVLIVVVCLAWSVFEFVGTGSPFWGVLFGVIGLYAGWHFFLNFNPRPPDSK